MKVVLEPPTPFHRSLLWRIHDGYFRARGLGAWTAGEVPYYATSNLPTAAQHARFLLEVAPPTGEVWVLEVGSGLGRYAERFLAALRDRSGPAGLALLQRLHYVLSDYSERSLREAVATPALAAQVDAGRLHPALLDLTGGEGLRTLDGERLPSSPFTAIVANYVCCVLPTQGLQWRTEGGWHEQRVSIDTEVDDAEADRSAAALIEARVADATRHRLVEKDLGISISWAPCALYEVCPDPTHQEALAALVAGRGDMTFGWPQGFLALMSTVGPWLAPGGYVLVNDYGAADATELRGRQDRRPQIYGNSLANAVAFPAFDAWARAAGWSVLRTHDPLASLHSAVLRPDPPWSDAERAAFARHCEGEARPADELLDASTVARRLADLGQHDRALRFYRRCLELEPDNAEYHHRAGRVAIDAGRYETAIAWLTEGLALAGPDAGLDFEFQLGRATCLLDDYPAALGWYERAVQREDHPTTWTNLGVVYEHEERVTDAFRCYERALAAAPGDERALERLNALRDRFWEEKKRELRTR